jgi:hypothetical protein
VLTAIYLSCVSQFASQQCWQQQYTPCCSTRTAAAPVCAVLTSVLTRAVPCCVICCLQASSAATAEEPCLDLSQLDVAAVMFDSAEPSSFRHAVQVRQQLAVLLTAGRCRRVKGVGPSSWEPHGRNRFGEGQESVGKPVSQVRQQLAGGHTTWPSTHVLTCHTCVCPAACGGPE